MAGRPNARSEILRLLLDGQPRRVSWLTARVNRVRPVGQAHVQNTVSRLAREGLITQHHESLQWVITKAGYDVHACRTTPEGHELLVGFVVDCDGERVVTIRCYRSPRTGLFLERPALCAIARDYFASGRLLRMVDAQCVDADGREYLEVGYVR